VILIYTNDSTHSADCIKSCYQDNDIIVAKLDEPLSEKEKTFKAEASVREIIGKNNEQDVKGSIIIYFQKDSSLSSIGYSSQIVFKKPLQLIKNAGNPESFDYQRYCDSLASFNYGNSIFQFCSKKILLIDRLILFQTPGNKISIDADAIIISKNPKIKIANLASVFNCNKWIFDASNAS
jgi:hypothetical protein